MHAKRERKRKPQTLMLAKSRRRGRVGPGSRASSRAGIVGHRSVPKRSEIDSESVPPAVPHDRRAAPISTRQRMNGGWA